MERYARQVVFSHLGEERQKKLLNSKVTIIGVGALGTVSANNLCRSGVGHIRIVDRDYVEISNLQRQILYNEEDSKESLPKAAAAFRHLSKVNSEINIEPVIGDVNSSNIESLIHDADLVLDATDNWEIRILLNEACHFLKIPWIYCAALGSRGMTMNLLPGEGNPCLRCIMPEAASAPGESCSTFGVLNMATGAIASIQSMEAIKILVGSSSIRRELLTMDLWENHTALIKFEKKPDCPVCGHGKYEYFGKASGSYTTSICGANSVQIVPAEAVNVDFQALAEKLKLVGSVRFNKFTLVFQDGKYEITLFRDGRAMIKNAIDGNNAKSIYTEYIGM